VNHFSLGADRVSLGNNRSRELHFGHWALGTPGVILFPSIESDVITLSKFSPRLAPSRRPVLRIAQLSFRLTSAAGDKSREPAAAGGLANRLISQVEAPADDIAAIGQAGVPCPAVHEKYVAGLHRQRNLIVGHES